MLHIEPIIRRTFSQPDRAATQEQVCLAVEANPERFLAAYRLDPRSFQGRYVNSDLMKESFPEYSASKEHRNRYNLPVHNAAAVLAAAQFRAVIATSRPNKHWLIRSRVLSGKAAEQQLKLWRASKAACPPV